MKILFMGTPEFSVFALRALRDAGENIVGVITQPDKPKGRRYTLTPSPVKLLALESNIPVYQPKSLRGEEFAATLAGIDPELIVVSAYGKILPQNVLDYPKYGCINIHGSLLPEYRGAAPMQRAIIDGRDKTGVTIMMMDSGLDTGDMLLTRETPIGESDNFEDIHDRLGTLGASALLETLTLLREGRLTRTPQDGSRATYAAKIEKDDCHIDFTMSARQVHNLIRGLSPVPLAFSLLPGDCILKVAAAEIAEPLRPATGVSTQVATGVSTQAATGVSTQAAAGVSTQAAAGVSRQNRTVVPGEVIALDSGIVVACGEGAVRLLRVTPECRCCMCAADFIRGRKVSLGDVLR